LSDLSPEDLTHLKRALLTKGAELAARLSDLLAGKRTTDAVTLDGGAPGERPEEKLRRFMARIDACLRELRAGSYGACEGCGVQLSFAALDQVPWADHCRPCASAAP
jgi:RNA polymerase-binding transcription factor DksA